MDWIKRNKHAFIGWGIILSLVLMLKHNVLLGAFGLKLDGWNNTAYAIRGPMLFLIFGGFGVGLYLLSVNGRGNYFRIKKGSLIPGLVLLFVVFLPPWLFVADFYLQTGIFPKGIGINAIDFLRLIQPMSKDSAFFRFPEYLLYIVTGFLLIRGVYGEKTAKD